MLLVIVTGVLGALWLVIDGRARISAVASFAWRGERLPPVGFLGAAFVLVAMVLSQRSAIPGPARLDGIPSPFRR